MKASAARQARPPQKRQALTPSSKAARDLIVRAIGDISFVNSAIRTEIHVEPDGFHVRVDTYDRDSGEPVTADLRDDIPPFLLSRDHAIDWIYGRVRNAWVHELNEAMFVDGTRRRDLHDADGRTIAPPDEIVQGELDALRGKIIALAMGLDDQLVT